MEERQTEAASVSRRITLRKISCALCIILVAGAAGFLLFRIKPEAVPPGGKDQGGQVLRFDVSAPLGSLDPIPDQGGSAPFVLHFLYSYLFIMNENGQLEPDLATSWSYDKERLTWTIRIREGARFHDGSPVTAADVLYSLKSYMEMALPSAYQLIDRMTAINELVISICLKKDDSAFLEKIWSFEIFKKPQAGDANDSMDPVGSGPFKLKYRFGNVEVGLIANEDYYRGRPAIDRVVFYYQPDRESSWARLLAGETDFVPGIDTGDYRIMEPYGDRFYFRTAVEPYLTILLFNTSDPSLNDPKVRAALSCAVDRQCIVGSIMHGMGVVPPGNMGYYASLGEPGLKPAEYDPSKSVRLLREAGWTYDPQGLYLQKDGKPLELTILFLEESRQHESIARYLQLCFNELGVKVHVRPLPFNEFTKKYLHNADFQAVVTEVPDVRDALNSTLEGLLFLNGKQTIWNSSPLIAQIIRQIGLEMDSSKRKALLKELDSLLDSFQPAAVLVQKTSLDVLSRRFRPPCDLSNMYYQFKLWQVSPASR